MTLLALSALCVGLAIAVARLYLAWDRDHDAQIRLIIERTEKRNWLADEVLRLKMLVGDLQRINGAAYADAALWKQKWLDAEDRWNADTGPQRLSFAERHDRIGVPVANDVNESGSSVLMAQVLGEIRAVEGELLLEDA